MQTEKGDRTYVPESYLLNQACSLLWDPRQNIIIMETSSLIACNKAVCKH